MLRYGWGLDAWRAGSSHGTLSGNVNITSLSPGLIVQGAGSSTARLILHSPA